MRLLLPVLLLLCSPAFAENPTFEIVDGDRVMLLGDTLLEREATYGHLETRMHEQFPAAHFSVRNIAWSAETPLGWSRASFDPADKGIDRLKEHIDLVQPTVAVLGFGMAASLQEMTDRSNDWTLNPDPARYGAEPMSAARFKNDLAGLMDVITASARGGKVRFILLSPIRHEDLRGERPGLPDPTAHNALLAEYGKVIAELAKERDATFVPCDLIPTAAGNNKSSSPAVTRSLTDNGIHLHETGYLRLAASPFSDALGWNAPSEPEAHKSLREAVLRKNALWFNRFRPANSTYLFGFRKHEQGRNAVEMEQFTPLLKAADEEIWRLARDPSAAASVVPARSEEPAAPALPLPAFTLAEGLEISLWAEAPMVSKPVHMNWDAAGRLWLAGTPIYPMIEPGKVASDRIQILEDSDHDGKADKSSVFADDLLLPTCVEPDITTAKGGPASAAYVGASTELLHLSDNDRDGRSDRKRIVLSGFGTEDTHHNLHTLYWGPDGLLYFNQSIYTHSHLETPWGVVRVNSGAVLSYDPRTEHTQVFSKGLWNPWGHKIDKNGQHFLTDGAGSTGLSWAFPGATFAPFEGARRTMDSISPGSYPKFAGLELIHSPNFPAAWQGSAVTCDFRAHKVVHFEITDLGKENGSSGYTTKALPVLIQTNDLTFRPIDVKLGPDGALYIADWTNPIINHGEVDFRDPRRDHFHGRIWRVTCKGGLVGPLDPRAAAGTTAAYTAKDLASESPRTRIGAMRSLARTPNAENAALILAAAANAPKNDPFYAFAAWRSVNDVGSVWVASVLDGTWKASDGDHAQQLEYALQTLPPEQASKVLGKVLPRPLPADGRGPWIELIGKTGSTAELNLLWQAATEKGVDARFAARALAALEAAEEQRHARPSLPTTALLDHLGSATPVELQLPAVRLAGAWKVATAVPALAVLVRNSDAARSVAIDSLREIANEPARAALKEFVSENQPAPTRAAAAIALGTLDFKTYRDLVFTAIGVQEEAAAKSIWRALFAIKGAPEQIAAALPKDLPKPASNAGLAAARELGKRGDALVKAFSSLTENASPPAAAPVDYSSYLARIKSEGDATRGELVYRRASLVCTACHAIGGAGGKVGPDLSSIGASAPLDYLLESLVAPNAKVKEGYNGILLTRKDGQQFSGVLVRENPDEFILRDTLGHELQVPKVAVTARENLGSLMPAGLLDQLSERERLDLLAFLSALGKPGPFDSTKATVARQWELWPAGPSPIADELPMIKRAPGLATLTLVDGRLTRGMIVEALALLPAGTRSLHARSRFTVATAGKVKLTLTGARKAWLDRSPLPIASEPSPGVELQAGPHELEVELDSAGLPDHLKVESEEVTFLAD